MKKGYDLITDPGRKLAAKALDMAKGVSAVGVITKTIGLVKKSLDSGRPVKEQVQAQKDLMFGVMDRARRGDVIEVDIDDGVFNGVKVQVHEHGDVALGASANGRMKIKIRRQGKVSSRKGKVSK